MSLGENSTDSRKIATLPLVCGMPADAYLG
jgi:hypothetical protein